MKILNKDNRSIIGHCEQENAAVFLKSLGLSEKQVICESSQSEMDREQLRFLSATDWKVTRHRDQVALDVETSISEEEYKMLLNKRQNAREVIADNQALNKYRAVITD